MATTNSNSNENMNVTNLLAGFKDEIVEAVLKALQGATPAPAPAPAKKSGKKHYHKASEYTPTEGELNICEYSDKTVAVYGDLKDKKDLIHIIKEFGYANVKNDKGNERELKANFMRNLPSITLADGSNPCGWLISKESLNKNGGMTALTDALAEAGAMVNTLDSVASVTAARKEAKKSEPTAPAAPTAPKTKTTTKTKTAAPASKPQTQVVSISKTVEGVCYEPLKNDPFFRVETRSLTKTQNFYTLTIEGKGTVCYILAGNDLETQQPLFIMVKKCKEVTDDIATQLNTLAKADLAEAVKRGDINADVAAMNIFARLGNEEMLEFCWNKIQAA